MRSFGMSGDEADWFFRHFDHAALVVTDFLLKKHPMLKGRILDVGCGHGLPACWLADRYPTAMLHGIDPNTERVRVAAMALGAGQAALDIAIPYARERVQFGSPLAEKKGYTNKLIVPHWVNLKAADAYIETIAHRLDNDNEDLQVEGSIAKRFL